MNRQTTVLLTLGLLVSTCQTSAMGFEWDGSAPEPVCVCPVGDTTCKVARFIATLGCTALTAEGAHLALPAATPAHYAAVLGAAAYGSTVGLFCSHTCATEREYFQQANERVDQVERFVSAVRQLDQDDATAELAQLQQQRKKLRRSLQAYVRLSTSTRVGRDELIKQHGHASDVAAQIHNRLYRLSREILGREENTTDMRRRLVGGATSME